MKKTWKRYFYLLKEVDNLNYIRFKTAGSMTQAEFNRNINKCRRMVKEIWDIRDQLIIK